MKLALRFRQAIVLATVAIFGGMVPLWAQSPGPAVSKGTPIIFSAPKSDTVSSNLSELRAPASPFRDMESTLKKPFEALSPGRPEMQKPAMRIAPPAQPEMRKKSLKEQMNERAEQMFLEPELHKGESDADIFGLSEDSYDPYEKKNKTSLDRYYDRVDRMATNQAASGQSSREAARFEDSLSRTSLDPLGETTDGFGGRTPFSQANKPLTGGNSLLPTAPREGSFSSRSYYNQADRGTTYGNEGRFTGFRQSAQETRLDAFKRLLQGSSASPVGNALTPPTPTSAARSAPVTTTYSPAPVSQPAGVPAANTFAESARLVGTPSQPQGVPDYTTPSVNPSISPAPAKPLPPPTFRLPERRM